MNDLRARLRDPEPLIGPLVTLDSPETAVILRRLGFSWFFLDLEHSALLDLKSAQRIAEVLQPDAFAVIRVPDASETWIKQALDTGCDGIIVPHVAAPEQARAIVAAAKYPPLGTRSVGIARAHGYGASFHEYLAEANDRIAVIAQIEEAEGVRNIDAILAVDGIDAAFVGPYDLSGSLGRLGRLSDPPVVAMIDAVREACRAADVPFGIFCGTADAARTEIAAGARLVAVGSDLGYLAAGASAVLGSLTHDEG